MLEPRSTSLVDRVGQHFYPLSILGVCAALLVVLAYLPLRFVVFGLYALLGLAGGAAFYYVTDGFGEYREQRVNQQVFGAAVYVIGALTVALVAVTGQALVVVAGLALGYLLVVWQLLSDPTPHRLLPQVTALFLLSPTVKYLDSGRYVGHGDLLVHTGLVEELMAGQSLGALAHSSYHQFPGLHLTAATVGSLSGLGAYDGIVLTGLVAYALVVPAVYVVTCRLTDDRMLALSVAFAVVLLDDLSFFVSYAFPQSLATVLLVVLVVLATIADRHTVQWPVAAAVLVVSTALAVTHHLTTVLAVPIALSLAAIYAIQGRGHARTLTGHRGVALLAVAAVINGIHLWRTGFLARLSRYAVDVYEGGLFGGYTQSVTLWFGTEARPASVDSAVQWLASPYGIYMAVLVAVFSIGVVAFLRTSWRSTALGAVLWTGTLGAVLVFETPVSIESLVRIRFPWLFVFAFVVGLGLYEMRRRTESNAQFGAVLLSVALLASLAPVVTADDYYGLDPRPTEQTSFSEEEYAELRSAAAFVESSDEPVTGFWRTRLVAERFDVGALEYATVEGRTIILPPGHFVYRSGWTDHEVSFVAQGDDSLYSNTVHVSGPWLSQRVEAGNNVYTAGGTGVLWSPEERPFGVGRSAK